MTRVADLDMDTVRRTITRATDRATRRSYSPLIDDLLRRVSDEAGAVKVLRNLVVIAVLRHVRELDDLSVGGPLGHALVRVMRHPAATPLPQVAVEDTLRGPDAAPTLTALVAVAPPELEWDRAALARDLLGELHERYGAVDLGDLSRPPPLWQREWDGGAAVASALFLLITLEELQLIGQAPT